ncbi:MAG: aspartate--tRNA ligase [Candidatus Omnitrophica bacterium]|nr:aspartate--tRNA ligase [Candidatus Omnitrophota bacterium]
MLRTHTCGQLTEKNIGKEVTLCGWVASRRDHGKLIFIDLRDRYGITQAIFLPKPNTATYELAKKLRNEDVVKIKGIVNLRPEKTENSNISTGLIEIEAQELDILSGAGDLPFNVEDTIEIGEEIRLKHRYLDLRRASVYQKLILRHKLNQGFRDFLNAQEFLEIETPFLTKSTPEGARDYLVPSRLQPNKFYALPQSPQLFKQILMVGGIDKYYQIVRCFRDEDLRRDRQPEFTQLDMELSFIDEEDIYSLTENMIADVFSKCLGVKLKTPFLRLSHQEAMKKHKTDKPDVGEGAYRFLWVTDFPLFEYNNPEKRWQSCHHPFTSPGEESISNLDKGDLSKVRARSYDLVFNGSEIASGSIRIHSSSLQEKIFQILGIPKEEAEKKFGFLLRSFKYGVPPHGGIAFGLDRMYAIISGSESIRDVIAFPKTQKGSCLLSDAPSYVKEDQLKDLYLRLIEEQEG